MGPPRRPASQSHLSRASPGATVRLLTLARLCQTPGSVSPVCNVPACFRDTGNPKGKPIKHTLDIYHKVASPQQQNAGTLQTPLGGESCPHKNTHLPYFLIQEKPCSRAEKTMNFNRGELALAWAWALSLGSCICLRSSLTSQGFNYKYNPWSSSTSVTWEPVKHQITGPGSRLTK